MCDLYSLSGVERVLWMEKSNETTRVLNGDFDAELFAAIATKNNDELLALLQRGANPSAVRGINKEPVLIYASLSMNPPSDSQTD
jgi:hypothetical protein